MDLERLKKSAAQLPRPSQETANEFYSNVERVALEVNKNMAQRDDLDRLIGEGNLAMMQDNHRNHARFMASLLQAPDPEVLVETVLWVYRAYVAHGFQPTYWPAMFDTYLAIYQMHLSEKAYQEVLPYYEWFIFNHAVLTEMSRQQKGDSESHPPSH